MAVAFTADVGLVAPLVKLIPQPIVGAESLALAAFRLIKQSHTPIGYTTHQPSSFLAWAVLTDPTNAHHALSLVRELQKARRHADDQAGKVKTRVESVAATMQESVPHFIPAFFEEIARIFHRVNNLNYAKQFFGKARQLETDLNLEVDPERHAAVFSEFAGLGVVSAKVFSLEARRVLALMEPLRAYQHFLALVIAHAHGGVPAYADVLKDLRGLGAAAGIDAKEVDKEFVLAYAPTPGFPRTAMALQRKILPTLKRLVPQHPEAGVHLAEFIPTTTTIESYIDLLKAAKLWENLRTDPARFRAWVSLILNEAYYIDSFAQEPHREFLEAIDANASTLTGLRVTGNLRTFHLDYLDAFVAAGIECVGLTSRYRRDIAFDFPSWCQRHYRDLSALMAVKEIRWRLVDDLSARVLTDNLDVFLETETTTTLVKEWLEQFQRNWVASISSSPIANLYSSRKLLTDMRLYDVHPQAMLKIFGTSPALALQEKLVDETWKNAIPDDEQAGVNKFRLPRVTAKLAKLTEKECAQLIDQPLTILEVVEGDEVLATAIAATIAEIGQLPDVTLMLPELTEIPSWLGVMYGVAPKEEGDDPTTLFPLPPTLGQEFSVNDAQFLAKLLYRPKQTGEIMMDHSCKKLVENIGQEKVLLARLSRPGIPIDTVRKYHTFYSWCANLKLLGTWRRETLADNAFPTYGFTPHWDNNALIVHTNSGFLRLWNQDVSNKQANGDDFFVAQEEFLSALDEILTWHEDRHEADTTTEPAWSDVTVAQIAEEAAQVSTLPPESWRYFFVVDRDTYNPAAWTDEWEHNAQEILGLSANRLERAYHDCAAQFGEDQFELLAATWHKDMVRTGPDIGKLAEAWAKRWGSPWIHLTDMMMDEIPAHYHHELSGEFHRNPHDKSDPEGWAFRTSLLVVYLYVAQLVEASSDIARVLAQKISHFHDYPVADDAPELCGSIEKFGFFHSALEDEAPRVVPEGYLDTLITYLKTGTPFTGTGQDPRASAPTVVADVEHTLGLSADAACYFLQLLALVNPTDTNTKKWNGWTKKQLDTARSELVVKKLVVEAKHTGASRSVFLPGGWCEKSHSGPGLEVWKAPHYLLWNTEKSTPVIPTCPPILPYPHLFTEVWQRYTSGDTPGYEDLRTTRYGQ